MTREMARTHREIWGRDPSPPYEWDAGNTPPSRWPGGRYTVRLMETGWEVIYHPFQLGLQQGQEDSILATFGIGEVAERRAKQYALDLVEREWEGR